MFSKYAECLIGLDGFSHIMLIYHLNRASGYSSMVRPFLEEEKRGLFATRTPRRPNPIGLSTVGLVKLTGRVLHIVDLDILDETPLLDIKPYIPLLEE